MGVPLSARPPLRSAFAGRGRPVALAPRATARLLPGSVSGVSARASSMDVGHTSFTLPPLATPNQELVSGVGVLRTSFAPPLPAAATQEPRTLAAIGFHW